ncbi:MAG: Pvc16 family protein [bacterium]
MTDFTAVRAASLTLRGVLKAAITDSTDPQLTGLLIDLRSPHELRDNNVSAVSLWLFHVRRCGDLYNTEPRRPTPDQLPRRPVPLELGYLVTPMFPDADLRQVVLGRVIETFNDHSTIQGAELLDTLLGTNERLYVHLDAGAPSDVFQIWQALHLPYQTCLPYLVEHVTIESGRPAVQVAPVLDRETRYTQVVAARPGP